MKNIRKILSFTVLLLLLSVRAYADQITLKNGDRVTGKIVKTDGGTLVVNTDLLGGLAWNPEYFKGDFNDRSSAEAQVGQTLSHRFSPRVSLKEQLFILPNLTNGGEYRINFDASLITDISRRIGWQVTLSDRYLSNPPPGLEKNDLLLTTGLKVKLGKF